MSFDVSSVKLTRPPNQGNAMMECKNDRFVSKEFPIAFAVRFSSELSAQRIAGMPDWTTDWSVGYDTEARAPRVVDQAECRQLVRQLLADRFAFMKQEN